MSDTIYPDWAAYPCLDEVITTDDLEQKGEGRFAANYVNWMRTSHLLRKHAAGWQFELRTYVDKDGIETDVWRAPDNTGYVKGFFRAPEGSGFKDTPDFPQAVMEPRPVLNPDGTPKLNRHDKPMMDANASKPWDEITARDVTDTHRRCMCTAAAAHFGLAWQLWAKEEIENPMREQAAPAKAKAPAKPKAPAPKANTPAQPKNKPSTSPVAELQQQVEKELRPLFIEAKAFGLDALTKWRLEFRQAFDGIVKNDSPTAADIQTQAQFDFTKTWLELFIADAKSKKQNDS